MKISDSQVPILKRSDVRYLDEMRNVLYDKKWAKQAPNLKLYYMYRGVKKKRGLRYDITVIPTRMLGKEFIKTKGHYHPQNYQELYVVSEGKGIFLIQKGKEKIQDVYAVIVKKGEVVIIPPNFGHITINPSKRNLKIANWVNKNCGHNYRFLEKMQGACYYYTKSGWIKNKNYKIVPKLRYEKPLKSMPKSLDFLKTRVLK